MAGLHEWASLIHVSPILSGVRRSMSVGCASKFVRQLVMRIPSDSLSRNYVFLFALLFLLLK
jgi:hypothetical protein